ncbi:MULTISPECIES: hypothetical protein [unclassified Lysobacter]|uniref:hypothetical protein n=1 Tax=unclassified Lysobacter TaxID=2635362 RepID=UPI001BE76953|nr:MULTISPECIES: hypothetical protein [unclassified Lysobacter]MBT2746487.1 hypothetical protein [Lysobacter sp. ISL-42]MBT2752989.1 hypothetical protein [Lysobacter sp. ISL-50]MBT2777666.1 hypothetical protein [Lysobacter sp. ISL-54]MBT2782437.1 hypothetical protein [Lysobacter sp. ISL-52]
MRLPMLSSRVRKLFAAGLTLALLSGCSVTSFESPPSGTQVACDPRLVGQWRSRQLDDTDRISILPKDCGLIDRNTGECPSDLIGYRFTYLPDATGGYIVATDATLATQPATCQGMHREDSDDDSDSHRGRYMLLRYVVTPDRIAIHSVDTLRMARLIAAGTVPGTVKNTDNHAEHPDITSVKQLDAALRETKAKYDEPQIDASVKGSSPQIDALLASRKDLFFAKPGIVLRRDGKAATKPSPRSNR